MKFEEEQVSVGSGTGRPEGPVAFHFCEKGGGNVVGENRKTSLKECQHSDRVFAPTGSVEVTREKKGRKTSAVENHTKRRGTSRWARI